MFRAAIACLCAFGANYPGTDGSRVAKMLPRPQLRYPRSLVQLWTDVVDSGIYSTLRVHQWNGHR